MPAILIEHFHRLGVATGLTVTLVVSRISTVPSSFPPSFATSSPLIVRTVSLP
ncbi:hypothetical protein [Synechocystis sp. LKSZ1]|uniref:hypothetical protein n=1 Tax=Synechocystis sp. LKSZ1 TaxID=3144951 RepID=UPI00336BCE47